MDPVKTFGWEAEEKTFVFPEKLKIQNRQFILAGGLNIEKRANRNPYAAPGRGRCQQWCGTGRSQRCSFDSEIYLSRKALLRSRKV